MWGSSIRGGLRQRVLSVHGLTRKDTELLRYYTLLIILLFAPTYVNAQEQTVTCTNNAANDTPAILTAYSALTTTGGRVRVNGQCTTNAITFPGAAIDVVIELNGTVTELGTWTMGDHGHLLGIGQGYKGSYALSYVGHINTPTIPNTPGILWNGINSTGTIKRIGFSARSQNAPAIKVLGGSNKVFEDVSFDLNAQGAQGIELDTTFWIRLNRIGIVGNNSSGNSVHIGFTGGGGYTGLITIKDVTMWNHGIKIDANPTNGASPVFSSIYIEDVLLENPITPVLDVDLSNTPLGGIANVSLKRFGFADNNASAPPLVRVRTNNRASAFDLDNYSNNGALLLDADSSILGLRIGSPANGQAFDGRPIGNLTNQRDYQHETQGRLDADSINESSYFAPSALPYSSVAVKDDPAQWAVNVGQGTISTAKLDPTGNLRAALITETSTGNDNDARVYFYDQTRTVSVGDWFVFGAYLKPDGNTSLWRDSLKLSLGPIAAGGVRMRFDGQTVANTPNPAFDFNGSGWMPIVMAAKVTSSDDPNIQQANPQVTFLASIVHGYPAQVFAPFLIHIPAGVMSDADVIRLKRTLRYVPANTAGGVVAVGQRALQIGLSQAGTCNEQTRGSFINSGQTGQDDQTLVCRKLANGSYQWQRP